MDNTMNNTTEDRRVQKTKKALRKSLSVLLAKKNIQAITVKELTNLADVHRGTFYFHYKDVYDLQEQIENEILEEIKGIFDAHPPDENHDKVLSMLTVFNQYLYKNAEICHLFINGNGNYNFCDKLRMMIKDEYLHKWIENLSKKSSGEDLEYFCDFIMAGYIAVVGRWLAGRMQITPEELTLKMQHMALEGIGFLN
ncbi:MAG: TetR/AcrR family transcriptional regulator C-terminal domain-containing protein [Lachnospiraceae bacterium]|nr:TetR/AcrR family transcriptional regulator C-terminal domain-containing protein [Lachnospiraceae bacterium]